jgi:hypothetical protein
MSTHTTRPLTASGLVPNTSKPKTPHYKSQLESKIKDIQAEIAFLTGATEERRRTTKECSRLQMETDRLRRDLQIMRSDLLIVNRAIEASANSENVSSRELEVEVAEKKRQCEQLLETKHQLLQILQQQKHVNDQRLQAFGSNESLVRHAANDVVEQTREIGRLREELDFLRNEISNTESEIKLRPNIAQSVALESRILELEDDRTEMEHDMGLYCKPLAEQKEIILKFVKEVNIRNAQVEAEIKSISSQLQRNEGLISDMKSGNLAKGQKYAYLLKKRSEIDEYIARFATDQGKLESQISELQTEAKRVSERIEVLRQRERDEPEIALLSEEIDHSTFTSDRLVKEVEARRRELNSLDCVESNYIQQSTELNDRLRSSASQLAQLNSSVDEKRETRSNRLVEMESQIAKARTQLKFLRDTLDAKQHEREKLLSIIDSNQDYKNIYFIDKEIQRVESEICALRTTIDAASFQKERNKLGELCDMINQLIVSRDRK